MRTATEADVRPLAGTIARAFHDDPMTTWMVAPHIGRLTRFFGATLRTYLRRGEVLTTPGHEAAALWAKPKQWRARPSDAIRTMPAMALALRTHVVRAVRVLGQLERAHPREPHWYLGVVGTDPPAQGKGFGAAVIHPVLDRCDATNVGAYLESSKEGNIPYYERFGFVVTGELVLPGGPTMWLMWRDPRP